MPDPGTAIIPIVALLSVVSGPGLLIAVAAGLRGWPLAAATPLCTFGLVGVAGPALPLLGVRWSPSVLVLCTLVVAGGLAAVRFAAARGRPRVPATTTPWRPVDHVAVAGAVLVSGVVGLLVMDAGTNGFTAIPQFWDTAFHANAIRYIADTGLSSPSALGALSGADGAFYYPNAFHLVAATLVMLTGVPVTAALEILVALSPGLFALGVAALVRIVSGRPSVAVAAALVACAFSGFPYDLAGVLLPYVMALALLPAFLALWSDLLSPVGPARIERATLLGLATVGLVALHPTSVIAAAVLCAAHLVQQWTQRRPTGQDAAVLGAGALATLLLGAPLLIASAAAATGETFDWPVAMPSATAVGELVTFAHGHERPQWWLAGIVALGLLGLRRHPELRWLVAGAVVFAAIFVMAASYEGRWVELLTRPWWNDRWRLVALWVVCVAPLAGAGIVVLRDVALDVLRRLRLPDTVGDARGRLVPAALLAALLLAVTGLSDGLYRERNAERIAEAFADGTAGDYSESDALTALATLVGPDARVMNDPYDGSPFMYALAGVRPVFPQPLHQQLDVPGLSPDRALLYYSFRDIDTDPAVRDVVRQMNITHTIVSTELVYEAPRNAPGMVDLDLVDSLQLVHRTATTAVYEILPDEPPTAS